jgi:hypothetical protein
MFDMIPRWLKLLTTRKNKPFQSSGKLCRGLPHVGTLSDGREVYSSMHVRVSTPARVVFVNGSYIEIKGRSSSMNISGRVIITGSDGSVSSISNSRIDIC